MCFEQEIVRARATYPEFLWAHPHFAGPSSPLDRDALNMRHRAGLLLYTHVRCCKCHHAMTHANQEAFKTMARGHIHVAQKIAYSPLSFLIINPSVVNIAVISLTCHLSHQLRIFCIK